jgi:hypothetical protein
VMIGIAIDFEWAQFPDYVREESPPPRPGATMLERIQVIRLNGVGSPLTTRPLDQFPDLYLQLAKADPSPSGHLKFAKKFGLLTDRASEDTSYWPEAIERMRGLINLAKDRANWPTRDGRYEPYEVSRHFTLRFQPRVATDEMELSIAPANLRAALTLQCLTHRAGGARTRSCKACGEVFEVGGASGSRSHKAFCSDGCRFNFNNRRKSAGQ